MPVSFLSRQLFTSSSKSREWIQESISKILQEQNRCAHTPMIRLGGFGTLASAPIFSAGSNGVDLYFKDESVHQTGSLKHRLARSLFMHKLASGKLREGMTVVEASSGSTAISEAWFARILGLPFIAVMSASVSQDKVTMIEKLGGKCVKVADGSQVYAEAESIVERMNADAAKGRGSGAHYMDQFTNAESATDWRGNNNLADSIIRQLNKERFPVPSWIVVGAGTGGTATTIGRFINYNRLSSKLCVVDPQDSVFFDSFRTGDRSLTLPPGHGSKVEGIGRPRVEPSFEADVIDRMERVPDAASFAAMRFLNVLTGSDGAIPGASSGCNLYGCILLIDEMRRRGVGGSVVSLLCDNGHRYDKTYYSDAWLQEHGFDIKPYTEQIEEFWRTGLLKPL